MTYNNFLSESMHAIRSQAPTVDDAEGLHRWLLSIGELLNAIRQDVEQVRYTEHCIGMLIAVYNVSPVSARTCLQHARNEAAALWPKVGA